MDPSATFHGGSQSHVGMDRGEEITERDPEGSKPTAVRPWSSLLARDYRLIWGAVLLANTASHMRAIACFYQVYELSGEPLQLGLTGLFRALPYICFGLFGGVLADVFDRKKLIVLSQILNLIPAIILAILTTTGTIQVWHIYLLSLLTATFQVVGAPARMALIPRLVPDSHLLNAVTLITTTRKASSLFGPVLAGILIARAGLGLTYFIDAALWIPAVLMVVRIRVSAKPEGGGRQVSLRNLVEGLRFVIAQQIILSLLILDFGAILVGYYQPILPIFADNVFHVSASGLSALYAAPAVGGILGSALLLLVGDVKNKGALAVIVTLLFGGSLALLGLSSWFWMGLVSVGILGLTDTMSATIRRTTVQLLAPDAMRGRASSFVSVSAHTTNALGAVFAGTAAALIGVQNAVLLGSALCITIVLGICYFIPQLWRYRSN